MLNEACCEAASALVPRTYVKQGQDARKTHEKHIQMLLQQRKLPDDGWSNQRIELLLHELALMDSNNFPENVGVGEREARIASELVAQRHYRLGHGVGRSGDIAAVQPKAAGSSLLAQLTNSMLLDLIRHAGGHAAASCVLLPVATGMAIMLVLLALRQLRPQARYVLWPRIDQKSCFKSMLSAGLEPVVLENLLEGDELTTNLPLLEETVQRLGAESIAAVLTTTSCFAPRGIDKLCEVAQLCSKHGIPHVVNNAYGVQSTKCMHVIQQAHRLGRVDCFIQSTDKNLLVPVGGAIVASSNSEFVKQVSQIYPGRGSAAPALDVFITLLSLGGRGYKELCSQRKENYSYLRARLEEVAGRHGERVLSTPNNPISIAVSLSSLPVEQQVDWTEFGSMLFIKHVSGTRVVVPQTEKVIGAHTFSHWGSHYDGYPCPYFTAAAAIGMRREEVDLFVKRLDKVFAKFKRKHSSKLEAVSKHGNVVVEESCVGEVLERSPQGEADTGGQALES